jgi:hypothetical protein
VAVGLSHEAQHLRVARLSEYYYLRLRVVGIFVAYALLQLQHHGTGGIDEVNVVGLGGAVGRRRFAVGAQQHLGVVERVELLVVDGLQTERAQAFALLAVVDYVAQTVERVALAQFLLGLAYRRGHAKAEPRIFVNLYQHVVAV